MWHHQRAWGAANLGWSESMTLEQWIRLAAPENTKGMRWMVPATTQAGPVTYWLDFHDLQRSWERLRDHLAWYRCLPNACGLGLTATLEVVNTRPMSEVPYEESWSDFAIDWVRERFRADIEQFGFHHDQQP